MDIEFRFDLFDCLLAVINGHSSVVFSIQNIRLMKLVWRCCLTIFAFLKFDDWPPHLIKRQNAACNERECSYNQTVHSRKAFTKNLLQMGIAM